MSSLIDELDDDEFIGQFESGRLSATVFHHREHLRLAWIYTKRFGRIEALQKVCDGIKAFASRLGKAERYHETITWAYVFLVQERMGLDEGDQSWEDFANSNADLFDWGTNILKQYYLEETLSSDLARRVFRMPDKRLK